MPPKGSSKAKTAAGLAQPTLAFKNRKPSLPSPSKKKATGTKPPATSLSREPSLRQSVSTDSIPKSKERPKAGGASNASRTASGDETVKTDDEVEVRIRTERGERRRLDVKSKEWDGLMRGVKEAMGGMQPIHAGPDTHNNIHHILRVFDMTSKYGPCVGVSRLQRWERAKKWGLNPPDEIRDILTTVEGMEDVSYRENVLHGWV